MAAVYRESGEIVEIGGDWLQRLKAAAQEHPLRRSRVCLHPNDDSAVQEMVLAICQDVLFQPDRHLNKAESFHMIEGELDLLIFDEDGEPFLLVELGAPGSGRTFFYRLNGSLFHALLPRTPFVVFHETTSGPFRKDDSEFASWAPQEPDKLKEFLEAAAQEIRERVRRPSVAAQVMPADELDAPDGLQNAEQPLIHSHAAANPGRVVILGAGGFLGQAIQDELRAAGIPTLPITSKDIDLSGPRAAELLGAQLSPSDSLVFLATAKPGSAQDETAFNANIAIGTSVLRAVRSVGCAHLVYVGTDAVYSYADDPVTEHTATLPASLYALMHRTREDMLRQLAPIPVAIVRLTQVYGPGDPHNAYGPNRMVRSALRAGMISLFGRGEELRDHICVGDVAAAIVETLKYGCSGLVNVASGNSISFASLADEINHLFGNSVVITHEGRKVPITNRRFDIAALSAALPLRRVTPLKDGLRHLIEAERRLMLLCDSVGIAKRA